MTDKFIKVEEQIEHPLEELFDIESGTTVVERTQTTDLAVVEHDSYDEKDKEIEGQFQEIYNVALETFHDTMDQIDVMDPKYRNKSREAAVQFLNTALSAAEKKANIKANKDKLERKTSTSNYTQNNLIFDRNELLKAIRSGRVIDNEDTQ